MGKITIVLSAETERRLRSFVAKKYSDQVHGKLSEVVESSVKEYLDKQKDEHIGSTQAFY
jgi:hypothetical protein